MATKKTKNVKNAPVLRNAEPYKNSAGVKLLNADLIIEADASGAVTSCRDAVTGTEYVGGGGGFTIIDLNNAGIEFEGQTYNEIYIKPTPTSELFPVPANYVIVGSIEPFYLFKITENNADEFYSTSRVQYQHVYGDPNAEDDPTSEYLCLTNSELDVAVATIENSTICVFPSTATFVRLGAPK